MVNPATKRERSPAEIGATRALAKYECWILPYQASSRLRALSARLAYDVDDVKNHCRFAAYRALLAWRTKHPDQVGTDSEIRFVRASIANAVISLIRRMHASTRVRTKTIDLAVAAGEIPWMDPSAFALPCEAAYLDIERHRAIQAACAEVRRIVGDEVYSEMLRIARGTDVAEADAGNRKTAFSRRARASRKARQALPERFNDITSEFGSFRMIAEDRSAETLPDEDLARVALVYESQGKVKVDSMDRAKLLSKVRAVNSLEGVVYGFPPCFGGAQHYDPKDDTCKNECDFSPECSATVPAYRMPAIEARLVELKGKDGRRVDTPKAKPVVPVAVPTAAVLPTIVVPASVPMAPTFTSVTPTPTATSTPLAAPIAAPAPVTHAAFVAPPTPQPSSPPLLTLAPQPMPAPKRARKVSKPPKPLKQPVEDFDRARKTPPASPQKHAATPGTILPASLVPHPAMPEDGHVYEARRSQAKNRAVSRIIISHVDEQLGVAYAYNFDSGEKHKGAIPFVRLHREYNFIEARPPLPQPPAKTYANKGLHKRQQKRRRLDRINKRAAQKKAVQKKKGIMPKRGGIISTLGRPPYLAPNRANRKGQGKYKLKNGQRQYRVPTGSAAELAVLPIGYRIERDWQGTRFIVRKLQDGKESVDGKGRRRKRDGVWILEQHAKLNPDGTPQKLQPYPQHIEGSLGVITRFITQSLTWSAARFFGIVPPTLDRTDAAFDPFKFKPTSFYAYNKAQNQDEAAPPRQRKRKSS